MTKLSCTGYILIVGAGSSIARSMALALAKAGYSLFLTGREASELARLAADIHIRYGTTVVFDVLDIENISDHQEFFTEKVLGKISSLSGIVFAAGTMEYPVQRILTTNLNGAVSILELAAAHFAHKKAGFIIGLSSVAGDRGRQSNYIYGCAKGGFTLYLQGLRNRLGKFSVRVITLKLGFVDTAMTFGLPGLFLTASPDYIARETLKILHKKHTWTDVIYLPYFWRYIMLIIKSLPEHIFKKLSL